MDTVLGRVTKLRGGVSVRHYTHTSHAAGLLPSDVMTGQPDTVLQNAL